MSNNNNGSSGTSGGIGFLGVLTIAFIVLKLCGVINWSWWWVTAPLWGGVAIIIAVLILALIMDVITIIAELIKK